MRDVVRVSLRLGAIALITALLVAFVQVSTQDIVDSRAERAAREARMAVLPDAVRFEQVSTTAPGVQALFEGHSETGLAGYVAQVAAAGYGGEVVLLVGLSASGTVLDVRVLSHAETAGLGTRVFAQAYMQNFIGKPTGAAVDALSGATRTSNAVRDAIQSAGAAVRLEEVGA